jgi:hypothetical protein
MQKVVNQYAPFAFRGPDDDVETYRMIAQLTGS